MVFDINPFQAPKREYPSFQNFPGAAPVYQLFNDGGLYHIEISPMICSANHWTSFYVIRTSVMKELRIKLFVKTDNVKKPLTISAKALHHRYFKGP